MILEACPFCRSRGDISEYCPATSMFGTIYQCGNCYQIFDDTKKYYHESNLKLKRTREKVEKEINKRKNKKLTFKEWFFSIFE